MHCGGQRVVLHSGGGPITVGSLDGNASLASGGGAIEVGVREVAMGILPASGGGAIEVGVRAVIMGIFPAYVFPNTFL